MTIVTFDPSQAAKKPRPPKGNSRGGSGSSGGGGISKEPSFRFAEYAIINGCFYQIYPQKDHEKKIRLCDFTAKIVEEITQDSGLEDSALLRIAVTRQDGRVFPVVDVPAPKFFNGSWVSEFYTTSLFLATGTTIREQLRACVQLYSKLDCVDIPNRTVFKYCGWKKINEQWHYLTGTGGINADGLQDSVTVDMGSGHISHYKLPAPIAHEAVKAAMPAIHDLLNICPSKKPIGAALLAAVARAPLGECSPIDFCLFVHGLTGSKKSSVVSVALSFFGEFAGNVFPANWSDTSNDVEAKSFQAKDAVFVIDDFKPSVSLNEAAKLHAMAERLIRNTGNGAGRGRRGADMSSRAAPYNRSMTIITGEDLPKGQSLLGRMLVLELLRNDVDCAALTRLQQAARDAKLSELMATYVQWLAPRMDNFKKNIPKLIVSLRDDAIQAGFASSHPRAPDIYASLVVGADTFLHFLKDSGALSDDQAALLSDNMQAQLKKVFGEQSVYQSEQDECERFLNLLRSLFSSGNAHVSDRINQAPPKTRPHSWGWRTTDVKGIDATFSVAAEPQGDCVGWYYEDQKTVDDQEAGKDRQIWLDQDMVFAKVNMLAKNQGDQLLMSPATLWRRMGDKGLIIKAEDRPNGAKCWTVKRSVAGVKRRVMVLSAEVVESGS